MDIFASKLCASIHKVASRNNRSCLMIRLGLYKIAKNVETLDLQECFPPYSLSILLRLVIDLDWIWSGIRAGYREEMCADEFKERFLFKS